jgi:hypothetical protein
MNTLFTIGGGLSFFASGLQIGLAMADARGQGLPLAVGAGLSAGIGGFLLATWC